jgi:hypothetical protein
MTAGRISKLTDDQEARTFNVEPHELRAADWQQRDQGLQVLCGEWWPTEAELRGRLQACSHVSKRNAWEGASWRKACLTGSCHL